jgi:tetratricopeptide (TPR) repeat protein
MRQKKVAFVGNCQADAIAHFYRSFIGAPGGEEVVVVDDTGRDLAQVAAAVQDSDHVVVQERDFNQALTADALRPGVRFNSFPMVLQAYLWPYAHEPHVMNAPEPPLPDGPYPGQLSDSFLNRLISKGVSPEEGLAQYLAHDIAKAAHLDRLYELHSEVQRERDERTGFEIAALMEQGFRDEALFMSPHHPNARLFGVLMTQLFDRMGVEPATTRLALQSMLKAPFPSGELPLHPGVIRHFGLRFANDRTRYTFHAEGRFTFEEYVLRYMRYEHNYELRKGMYIVHHGDLQGAVDALEIALKTSPQSDQGWRTKGLALHHMGRRAEAIEAYRQATVVAPDDAEAWFDYAESLMYGGPLPEAAEAARRAIALAPTYGLAHMVLTEILVKYGDVQGAEAAGRDAVRLLPGQPRTLLWSGIAFLLAGDPEAARANVLKAIAIEPKIADHRNVLADSYETQGRRDEAIAALEACVADASPNAQTFSLLGNFQLRSGRLEEAAAAFERGLELEPGRADLQSQARETRERLAHA